MVTRESVLEVSSLIVELLATAEIPHALRAHDLFDITPFGASETKIQAPGRVLVDRETFLETVRVAVGGDKRLVGERLTDLYVDALTLKGAAATLSRTFPSSTPSLGRHTAHYLLSRAAGGDVFITTDRSPERQR